MNSKLELTYKDADGFNQCDSFVLQGLFTQEQINTIHQILTKNDADGCFIIAHELELPTPSEKMADEGFPFPTEKDHVFTMIDQFHDRIPTPEDFATEEKETVGYYSTVLFVARLEKAAWDIPAEMARLGMDC